MRTSQAGIDLITRFEGFRERSSALGTGEHVIGFGHTKYARGNQKITHEDALDLLSKHDLPPIEAEILARCLAPLSQNEFDALVAFAFNIGLANFLESDVFALINSGAKLRAAEAMASWRKALVDGRVIVVDALVRRRASERALFLEVEGGPTPAPTPIIRPMLDLGVAILSPREEAHDVDAESGIAHTGDTDIEDASTHQRVAPEPPEDILAELPVADDEGEQNAGESAPEAAARAVTARLTRILGEMPSHGEAESEEESEAGPSVDEITRAVEALADPEGEAGDETPANGIAQPPVDYVRDETLLPELDDDDEIQSDPHAVPPEVVRDPVVTFVDDLERIDAGTLPPPEEVVAAPRSPWGSVILFAIAAFGGAIIAAWGLSNLSGIVSENTPLGSDWDLYAGPFAILLGGLIFAIMTYYLVRALFSDS